MNITKASTADVSELYWNSNEKRTHLHAKAASVHIVAQEEIGIVGYASADFKELHKIILWAELRMGWKVDRLGRKRTYCPCMSPQTKERLLVRELTNLHRGRKDNALVTGLLTSTILGSRLSKAVASRRMNKACSSVSLPSRKKWSLRNVGFGRRFPPP